MGGTGWRVISDTVVALSYRCGLRADRRAVTAVEYAIIAGLIVVAIVTSVPLIAPGIIGIFNKISPEL
jgi:Flp pilus assembly pilin Flp